MKLDIDELILGLRQCGWRDAVAQMTAIADENDRLRAALLVFARLAPQAEMDPSDDGSGRTTVAEFVRKAIEGEAP